MQEWSGPQAPETLKQLFAKLGVAAAFVNILHPTVDPRSKSSTSKSSRLAVFNVVLQDVHFPSDGDRIVLAARFDALTREGIRAAIAKVGGDPAALAKHIKLVPVAQWPDITVDQQQLDIVFVSRILIAIA